jgi:Uma2 family endonuclease
MAGHGLAPCLTAGLDDGIVVGMEKRITTHDYFRMPESNRPAELVYGVVREPPAPSYGHQKVVGRLFLLLSAHVEALQLGDVLLSPMDVVLDEEAGLVVQPDLMFISTARASIIRNHVWGAPDLLVEVASPATEYRDRTIKLSWYRKYGVRECWFMYPSESRIDVVDCAGAGESSFAGAQKIVSRVLPELRATAEDCFPWSCSGRSERIARLPVRASLTVPPRL